MTTTAVPPDPTVGQAIDAYVAQAGDVEADVLIRLGQLLGRNSRLSALDYARTAHLLAGWVEKRWSSRSARARAVVILRGAVDYWRTKGWISHDLGEFLR